MLLTQSALGPFSGATSEIVLVALLALATGATAILALMARHAKSNAKKRYIQVARRLDEEVTALREQLNQADSNRHALLRAQQDLEMKVQAREREVQETRMLNPSFKGLLHNIGVIGALGSGKSALISKLIGQRFMNLPGLRSTTTDKLDRTVLVELDVKRHMRTEHVLRFYEWGGEHLVSTQNEILMMSRADFRVEENGLVRRVGLQAMIFVVDLACPPFGSQTASPDQHEASPDQHEFSQERIDRQVQEYFSIGSIRFLLNEHVLSYLQIVVLFVNKSDCLHGLNHSQIESKAKELYRDVIMRLRQGAPQLEVIVGSVYTEAGLHSLLATLATRILPSNAWDASLRSVQNSGAHHAKNGTANSVSSPNSGGSAETSMAIQDDAQAPAA